MVFVKGKGPIHVHIQEDGCEIVLRFNDWSGEGDVMALEINPRRTEATLTETDANKVKRASERIDPSVVRRVGRNYATYVEYARSLIQHNREKTRESLTALGKTGKTRRGLSLDFLSGVADEYRDLVANHEPYPVKALAEMHHVVISRSVPAARGRAGRARRREPPRCEDRRKLPVSTALATGHLGKQGTRLARGFSRSAHDNVRYVKYGRESPSLPIHRLVPRRFRRVWRSSRNLRIFSLPATLASALADP